MGAVDRAALSKHLMERFLAFCRDHRGVGESVLGNHRLWLGRLFSFMRSHRVTNAKKLSVSLLDGFLLKASVDVGTSALNGATSAMRQFLRFLYQENILHRALADVVVKPRRFRGEHRPKYIPWHQVEELLRRVDRRTICGKRAFAILTLMAYQGLRALEVGRLHLEDIRWESRSIFIRRRKTGRPGHLPLAPITLEALKDYLTVRPNVNFPEVFVSVVKPERPLGRYAYAVARRRIKITFGDQVMRPGAYTLRHSFAKMLLDNGAPLAQISQLMGHARLSSTMTYLRVATEDLREVARNYADLL